MNATISYHTVNGKIRSTTVRPTGNSCAANFRFTPYGKQIKTVMSFIPPYFGWVGSYGYRQTNLNHAEQYIRARHYSYRTDRSPIIVGKNGKPAMYPTPAHSILCAIPIDDTPVFVRNDTRAAYMAALPTGPPLTQCPPEYKQNRGPNWRVG